LAHRDIVVIGTSRGGLEALRQLAPRLPADLPAAVLIVMHLSPDSPGYLAEMLNRTGPLPAADARDGEELQPGRIYVAVPGRHLMVEDDRIRLSSGPRESHARPSVDVLFRSAAFSYGPRVIGIVLTGLLDDGTAGLWAIKDRGGIAIVQSPREAEYPSMPESAKKHVKVDYVLTLAEIPEVLRKLTAQVEFQRKANMPGDKLEIENRIALEGDALSTGVRSLGQPSFYTCPECHGSMVAIQEGSIKRFRCHTGHGFTAESLLEEALPRIENSLWARWPSWKSARCCCWSSSTPPRRRTPRWRLDTPPRLSRCAGWPAACGSLLQTPHLLPHRLPHLPKSVGQLEYAIGTAAGGGEQHPAAALTRVVGRSGRGAPGPLFARSQCCRTTRSWRCNPSCC
jgi:two-component system chemotaxis response regulator CheB